MKAAIYGYGNIGRGTELALHAAPDMEIFGIFTRRDPAAVHPCFDTTPVYPAADILQYEGQIDIVILCAGSATELPVMTPDLAAHFNVIDSFDTHARIPEHFSAVDAAAQGRHLGLICGGWDPGMFSLARLYARAILPEGRDYTFWGRGVSQGHSNAIRRIEGVLDARQYTVPIPEAMDAVRAGTAGELTTREKHLRECYVVAAEGADKALIEQTIKTMPNYFADYDTTVTFITQEEMDRDHAALPHGGSVIRTGTTGVDAQHRHTIEYHLELDSNPEFTSSVLVALARAIGRMNGRGRTGCVTIFDIAPADLSPLSPEELRAHVL